MITEGRVEAKLNSPDESEMSQLLKIIGPVPQGVDPSGSPQQPGLLSRLRQIKIEAPEDFSVNIAAT